MQRLTERQLAVMRVRMPSFAEMEARTIKSDENAARAERVAKGIEPLIDPAAPPVELAGRAQPPEPLPSAEVTTP